MKRNKSLYIIIFLLIGSFCLSVQPRIFLEDANFDKKVDIKDAVLNAQRVLHSNKHIDKDSLHISQKVCRDTLNMIAGINNISRGSLESDDLSFSNLCFLVPQIDYDPLFVFHGTVVNPKFIFKSIDALPLIFPPILA